MQSLKIFDRLCFHVYKILTNILHVVALASNNLTDTSAGEVWS